VNEKSKHSHTDVLSCCSPTPSVSLTQMQAGLKDICLADDAFTEFTLTHSKKIWTINGFSVFVVVVVFSLATSHYTKTGVTL